MEAIAAGGDVSVVVATYNRLEYLGETLDGINGQTVRPGEIVLVDDASTEDVRAFVDEYTGPVPIRYERLDRNHGVAAARNLGNGAAQGRWIAVCDSDDVWLPQKLERQLSFINEWNRDEPLVALGSDALNVSASGHPISWFPGGINSVDRYRRLIETDVPPMCCHASVIYLKEAVERCGGYPTNAPQVTADTELLAALTGTGVVLTLPEVLVHYRKHESGMTVSWRTVVEQNLSVTRIGGNMRRRRLGLPEVSPSEFASNFARRPLRFRAGKRRYCVGKFLYRSGAVYLVQWRATPRRASCLVQGATRLALACVFQPSLVRAGLRRLGPMMRAPTGTSASSALHSVRVRRDRAPGRFSTSRRGDSNP